MEPAAEVLLGLIKSAVIKRSLLISLEHPGQPSLCLQEWRVELVTKIRYVPGKLAVLEGLNRACWVGLAELCYQYESTVRE